MSEISPFEIGKMFAGLDNREQVGFFSGIAGVLDIRMYDVEYCQCFRCGKRLENISLGFGDLRFQPLGGTCFVTYGHYGSTVFHPVDGSKLEIVICDECLGPLIGGVNKEVLYESWAEEADWDTTED